MKNNNFKSAEHSLNYIAMVERRKSKNSSVKVYTGEELQKLAESMGYPVSQKHVPPQNKATTISTEIKISDLPAGLTKFIKEG